MSQQHCQYVKNSYQPLPIQSVNYAKLENLVGDVHNEFQKCDVFI